MFATNDALASGGMTNCWLRCGLTMFFLRPTDCVVAGARDDATLHDLVFEQHQRPACPAVGRASTRVRGRGAGQGDQFRLGFAIEDTPTRGVRRMMTRQSPVHAFFNQMLAGSRDRIDAGFQRGGNLAVAPPIAGVRGVGFQQDTCLQQLPRGVLSLADHRVRLTTFLVAERHDVFLDRDLFPGHRIRSVVGAASSSQRLTAESRTWGSSSMTMIFVSAISESSASSALNCARCPTPDGAG